MASELFEKALMQLEEAREALSWSGSQPPEDEPILQRHYQLKRQAVLDYVTALETRGGPYGSAWALVQPRPVNGRLNVVYALGHTRSDAIKRAGRAMGSPPYSAADLRRAGFKAMRVRIYMESEPESSVDMIQRGPIVLRVGDGDVPKQ